MNDNKLDILGLEIVDYLTNSCGYKINNLILNFSKKQKGEVYLINEHAKYNFVRIIKTRSERYLKNIDYNLNVKNDQKALVIVLNDFKYNEKKVSPNLDIVVISLENAKTELHKIWPHLNLELFTEKPEEQVLFGENHSTEFKTNRRFLKKIMLRTGNPYLLTTWFLLALPILGFFFQVFTIVNITNGDPTDISSYDLATLIVGGSYQHLVFGAYQYWRWITWPFINASMDILSIQMLLGLWIFYKIGRLTEAFYGRVRSLFIWIISIVILGFIHSVIDAKSILSGFLFIVWVTLGSLIPFMNRYQLQKTRFMQIYLNNLILVFVILILQNSMIITLYSFLSFVVGGLTASIIGYNYKAKISYDYFIAWGMMLLLIGFGLALLFTNNYYRIDYRNLTFDTLQIYVKQGIISREFATSVYDQYFSSLK